MRLEPEVVERLNLQTEQRLDRDERTVPSEDHRFRDNPAGTEWIAILVQCSDVLEQGQRRPTAAEDHAERQQGPLVSADHAAQLEASEPDRRFRAAVLCGRCGLAAQPIPPNEGPRRAPPRPRPPVNRIASAKAPNLLSIRNASTAERSGENSPSVEPEPDPPVARLFLKCKPGHPEQASQSGSNNRLPAHAPPPARRTDVPSHSMSADVAGRPTHGVAIRSGGRVELPLPNAILTG